MNDHALWNLTLEALTALRSHYEPVIERIITRGGARGVATFGFGALTSN